MPLIPGYFPEGFSITHVDHTAKPSTEVDLYAETYASETHFFVTIQRQGPGVEEFSPQDGVTFQDEAGMITIPEISTFEAYTDLTLDEYDTNELWMTTVVLREIQIQAVTNLPREEIVQFTESLVPAICTEKPEGE
jgi:hypothetical protein